MDGAGRTTGTTPLPTGVLWRRAATQLATRLGVFPGDRVVVAAPPDHDPTEHLASRLPRVSFLRIGGSGPFRFPADRTRAPRLGWVRADPADPPVQAERIEVVALMFGFPLLDEAAHAELVAAWAEVLPAFGKWFELVAVEGPNDPNIALAEEHLRENGFEKVRSTRLALGRMGSALYLVSGRATGPSDEEE